MLFGNAVLYCFKIAYVYSKVFFHPLCNLVDFQMRTRVSWGHFTKLLNEFGLLRESAVAKGIVYIQNIIAHITNTRSGTVLLAFLYGHFYFIIFLLTTVREK